MFIKIVTLVLVNLVVCYKYNNLRGRRTLEATDNFNETFFPPLLYEVTRDPPISDVQPSTYPWLARVIPTQYLDHPTICTASCIRKRVFVTSARCVIGLTVGYASVVYKDKILEILTIVVPNPEDKSKQYFDDVGLIVTKSNKQIVWEYVDTVQVNRTDSGFQWFSKLGYEDKPIQHKMLVYYDYAEKSQIKRKLLELPVVVGIQFCQTIYSRNHELKGYFVPCVSACTYQDFLDYSNHENCKKQIAVDGAAVFNTETKKLLGVATWVGKEIKQGQPIKLPVGIAVVNSKKFWNDFECALRIRDYVGEVRDGFYQKLCDGEGNRHYHSHGLHSDELDESWRTSNNSGSSPVEDQTLLRGHFIHY